MECTTDKLRWSENIEKNYQWLKKSGLKDSTEALLMAAQEQALSTRATEARVYHTRQDPRCRLCGDAPETVQHITAGCKMLAGKAYMERHNQVAGIVYRNICTEYGLEVPGSRWETPTKVLENKQAKILWDFQIQTHKMVVVNQPDIVVVDKHRKTVVVIDVAILSDSNIRKKEHEKLKEEMERMWGMKATVVPVVIGTLRAVTPKLSTVDILFGLGRGEQVYDIYSHLLRERIICVMGPVMSACNFKSILFLFQ
ncbi:ATP-dependent Clp protease proteolytic subunit, mitochondrial [Takifugu flavidus]|uniref:ATP-dependent Clp protease proteolytic subunit, mitochondrial n=1 Tax=Takifugu flavidus TaxID=433684 RepID=A0A5C6NRR1_9TELE|nr:ATP-dependent Clp protease proteolytic subunit, mitochondrial [Takifugu flavidus]